MAEPITVLGAGDVGRRLAGGFRKHGRDVVVATRDPTRHEAWQTESGIPVVAYAEAGQRSGTVVLCTPWSGTQEALQAAGVGQAGRLVIDVTNPLVHGDGLPELALGHTDSGGEQVQRWLPDARVVKCWNLIGNPFMVDPDFDEPPTMWIAGDDPSAKGQVSGYLREMGWQDVVDLGPISMSRFLEPLAMVWIATGASTGSWDHALRLVRK